MYDYQSTKCFLVEDSPNKNSIFFVSVKSVSHSFNMKQLHILQIDGITCSSLSSLVSVFGRDFNLFTNIDLTVLVDYKNSMKS